jgi:hypothetical protein
MIHILYIHIYIHILFIYDCGHTYVPNWRSILFFLISPNNWLFHSIFRQLVFYWATDETLRKLLRFRSRYLEQQDIPSIGGNQGLNPSKETNSHSHLMLTAHLLSLGVKESPTLFKVFLTLLVKNICIYTYTYNNLNFKRLNACTYDSIISFICWWQSNLFL